MRIILGIFVGFFVSALAGNFLGMLGFYHILGDFGSLIALGIGAFVTYKIIKAGGKNEALFKHSVNSKNTEIVDIYKEAIAREKNIRKRSMNPTELDYFYASFGDAWTVAILTTVISFFIIMFNDFGNDFFSIFILPLCFGAIGGGLVLNARRNKIIEVRLQAESNNIKRQKQAEQEKQAEDAKMPAIQQWLNDALADIS